MTREEEKAIKNLKSKMDGSVDTSYEWAETVRMAIEALKAPTKSTNTPTDTPTDLISRQDVIETFKTFYREMGVDMHGVWNKQLVEKIKIGDTDDTRLKLSELWKALNEIPSAGQNCILCEYYTENETDDGIRPSASDFCSYGERKSDE